MDLIYTNSARVDQGVLQDYELDLAFGADENNLECKVQAGSHCCESGSLLYIEGTEYGGIIDSIESDTDSKEVIYTGRTWHGILNSKVIQPDSGEAYLVLNGEANAVIADLLSRLALTDLFEASSEDSGLNIKNYKMNRYISGYDGIMKMLGTAGGKLKLTFSDGKVVLAAEAVHDYTQDEEFDADQVPFRAKRNYKGVNHLICLGSGQLEERMVVHLYADTDGNISRTQTQFDLDEVCTIFEYSNVETEEELVQEGRERFESLMAEDEISIDFDADSDTFDVGDIIGAVDNITGLAAHTTIAKKIVTIKNGKITISLTPDKAKEGSSYEGSGNSGGESVDAYTKAETLSSEVKTMLGLEEDATPADAFKALKTIMFCPQIVVTSQTGSTVTCRKGDTILFADEVDGKWTFNVTEYGEWTVVASLGAASNSATVQVYAVRQMPIEISVEYATIFVTGLGENSTVKADLRKQNPDIVVPDGYTQLEHIASTGTQYINTGFCAKNTTKIITDCEITYGSSWTMVLGSYGESKDFSWWTSGQNLFAYYGTSHKDMPGVSGRTTIIADNNNWSAGNSTATLETSVFTATRPTYLFSVNGGGSYALATMKLYSCKIFDNESLVRDFVPAKRNSDSAVGLYDLVNDVFYTNAGSGAFAAGEEIPKFLGYVEGKMMNGVWVTKTVSIPDENTLLLLHGEEVADDSYLNHATTNRGVSISGDQSKFGGKSLYFNGAAELSLSGNSFNFGTGDFTIEMWVYLPKAITGDCFSFGGTVRSSLFLGFTSTGNIGIGRVDVAWDQAIAHNIPINTWTHIAVCRKNGRVYFFKNGTLLGSGSNTNSYSMQGGLAYVGSQGAKHYYSGYIDEVRVSDVARWTENFIPETEPYSGTLSVDASGYEISPITDLGTWTVTADTATQDVQIDELTEYSIEMG